MPVRIGSPGPSTLSALALGIPCSETTNSAQFWVLPYISFHLDLSKSRETWKNLRWHICATFGAKAATSLPSEKEELGCRNTRSVATTLYVPIRVSVPDNSPAFHARCRYGC